MKRIAIIFLATIIFFAGSIAIPHEEQKAQANPLVIPAGLQGAAGVYVIGGLLVAGGLGAVGYDEYGEEIKAHTQRAWDNATQISKDSIDISIGLAQGAGNGLVEMGSDLMNWLEKQIQGIGLFIADTTVGSNTASGSAFITNNNGAITIRDVSILYGGASDGSTMRITARQSGDRIRLDFRQGSGERTEYFNGTLASWESRINSINTLAGYISFINSTIGARRPGMFATIAVNTLPTDYSEAYNNAVSKTREQWESMRDAGLVLPVDSFVPTSAAGEPLTYNPATGELTGIDGGVYTGEVDWRIPNLKWREADSAIPTTGVYVDTPVAVPGVDVPAVSTPTTTNITTGATVRNPDIPIEGDVPGGGTPTNPPENNWNRPPTKKPPNIGALITTKFPFSLPWDLLAVLTLLNAEPKTPEWKVNAGEKIPIKFDISMKFLEPYMGFFRWFIILGFSFSLILMTRKLLGGAGS